jgi:hypothetical protein
VNLTSWREPILAVHGGMRAGTDGRIHTTFTHNPSSLRLSSVDPNLQNLPRGNDSEIQKWVKEMFVAPAGSLFWARDFSAIEAVLVGYFAGSPRYIRFAKLGVHAYLASHITGRPALLEWADEELKAYFKALKKEEPSTYDTAKRIVHGSNYMMTPRKMHYEYPETFRTVQDAARLQGLYFELFPEIREWHRDLCLRVDGTKQRRADPLVDERIDPWTLGVCFAQNPFGYVHRFYNVLDWERIGPEWVWSYGEDAKRLVSFLPQSTAAAIIKRATKRLWYEFPWVGETLRLLIHDEIFGECKESYIETCLRISGEVMEEPIPELPLDPAWGLGTYLTVGTEAKVGQSWATMH